LMRRYCAIMGVSCGSESAISGRGSKFGIQNSRFNVPNVILMAKIEPRVPMNRDGTE
jgi:hypothetical protein